ncbi:hypothetical protein DY000_02061941 [Brassica cretica]|uniref:Uncharacterized protein n=1 Tax=Brassica cretica TaxID=69181 RepID=A0ABQ7ATE9_BRACR|nr:hypothetical protein DY000_02061941 [Brassica cretica]
MVATVEDATPPHVVPPSSGEMAVSPASVASMLDSEFTADGGAGSSRNASFHPIPWNFSLSDLNYIGALGKLSRPSDSDIGFRRWTSLF